MKAKHFSEYIGGQGEHAFEEVDVIFYTVQSNHIFLNSFRPVNILGTQYS